MFFGSSSTLPRSQVASGVPEYRADHAVAAARLALDFRDALARYKDARGEALQVRVTIQMSGA